MLLKDRVRMAWKRRTDSTFALCELMGAEGLTYCSVPALQLLASEAAKADKAPAEAMFLEVGCARGGSSIVISKSKSPMRRLEIYDVFGRIPAPTEQDFADSHQRYQVISEGQAKGLGGGTYYGYEQDLLTQVKRSFELHGVPPAGNSIVFVEGDVRKTLDPIDPIAFAHIDCDWYEPVRFSLTKIIDRLIPGGAIIIDDYYCYKGCTAAVWDTFRETLDDFDFTYGERLKITKLPKGSAEWS